jgi:putative zinc finger/helix-turn-helix YgiT family protein
MKITCNNNVSLELGIIWFEVIRMSEWYCEKCMCERETKIVQTDKELLVKSYPVQISATIRVCSVCGERIGDNVLDDINLDAAFREYRNAKNLLMPEQIKAIREQYGLTQVAFAKILGLGDKTITRYENGSLQDEAQNNLILLVQNPENFATLFSKNKNELSPDELEQISLDSPCSLVYPMKRRPKYTCSYPTDNEYDLIA